MDIEKTAMDRYFEETEPAKRRRILEEELKGEPEFATLEKIWNLRFHNDPTGRADGFLRQFMELCIMPGGSLFAARRRKEILKMMAAVGFGTELTQDHKTEHLLYRELRNMFRRYIESCSDAGYGRKLFGLLTSTEKEKEPMICRDLYAMTLGTAERYDLEKEMATAIEAANDEYVAFRPEAGSLRQAYERFYPGR